MDIAVPVETPFEVRLERSAGTGYDWEVATLPGDVRLLSSTEVPKAPGRPGGPVEERFAFVVDAAGTYTVVFALRRPWEAEPARTVTATVTAD